MTFVPKSVISLGMSRPLSPPADPSHCLAKAAFVRLLLAVVAVAVTGMMACAQGWSIEPSFPGLQPLPGMPMEYDLYHGGSRVGRLEESLPGLPQVPGLSQEFDVYDRSGRRIGTAEVDLIVPGLPDARLRLNRRTSLGRSDDD